MFVEAFICTIFANVAFGHVLPHDSKSELRFKRGDIDEVAPGICGITDKEEKELKQKQRSHALDRYPAEEHARLFQGDMILTKEQYQQLQKMKAAENGKATAKEVISLKIDDFWRHWPTPEIPFMIDTEAIEKDLQDKVKEAMQHIENFSCVKFNSVPYEENPTKSVIKIFKKKELGGGIAAGYGMSKDGPTNLSLDKDPAMIKRGDIVHELMHTLGFMHEHARQDRHKYVSILYQNIEEMKIDENNDDPYRYFGNFDQGQDILKGHFTLYKGETYGAPYDFNSIMHYAPFAFAKGPEEPTIVLKPEWKEKCEKDPDCILGQRHGLSKTDAFKLNKLFKCPEKKYEGCDTLHKSWNP